MSYALMSHVYPGKQIEQLDERQYEILMHHAKDVFELQASYVAASMWGKKS